MATYTYRTGARNQLIYGGKTYRNGDRITMPKSDAQNLVMAAPMRHRFEETNGDAVIDMASIAADTAPQPADTPAKP